MNLIDFERPWNWFRARIERQNILGLPYHDQDFDCSVCFRLIHHFEDAADKEAVISGLRRVTSRYVVISYFSPWSINALRRRFRKLVHGKPIKQFPDSPGWLARTLTSNGFKFRGRVDRSRILHSL